ncbi:MAG TPA: cyanophycinase [Flavobacterium sp.]|jgi:cyanophycinase
MKGKLIIIGGAVDKGAERGEQQEEFSKYGILRRILDESAKGNDSRVEIITTASTIPDEMGKGYVKAFTRLGATNVGVAKIQTREDVVDNAFIERIKAADVAFFTGGDQIRLTSLLGGSEILKLIKHKLQKENFIYAGTSAGAAAASDSMVFQGILRNALKKGEIRVAQGFGLVDDIVIDTHFMKRGRIGRLCQIVVTNPGLLGVGLEENTGLLIKGRNMEAIGFGSIILIDGHTIKDSNLLEVGAGDTLSIDGMTLHTMSTRDMFDLETRRLKIRKP